MSKSDCQLIRSWLFVPAHRRDMFSKAVASGSDAIILDLEDSVPERKKQLACTGLVDFLERSPTVSVWLRPTLAMLESRSLNPELLEHASLQGLLLPKVESAGQVVRARRVLPSSMQLVILIESAKALVDSSTIARVEGVSRLCFGQVDFLRDVRASSYQLVRHCLMQLVLASRDADIAPPVAGVTTSIHDVSELQRDTSDALSLGCCGKLCIHPAQVPLVNELHRPSDQQIAWARAVLRLNKGNGVFSHEGRMIDAPVLAQARWILRYADACNNMPSHKPTKYNRTT